MIVIPESTYSTSYRKNVEVWLFEVIKRGRMLSRKMNIQGWKFDVHFAVQNGTLDDRILILRDFCRFEPRRTRNLNWWSTCWLYGFKTFNKNKKSQLLLLIMWNANIMRGHTTSRKIYSFLTKNKEKNNFLNPNWDCCIRDSALGVNKFIWDKTSDAVGLTMLGFVLLRLESWEWERDGEMSG